MWYDEMESTHEVLLHTKIRWLSQGKKAHVQLSCKLRWTAFHGMPFVFGRTDELGLFRLGCLTDIG